MKLANAPNQENLQAWKKFLSYFLWILALVILILGSYILSNPPAGSRAQTDPGFQTGQSPLDQTNPAFQTGQTPLSQETNPPQPAFQSGQTLLETPTPSPQIQVQTPQIAETERQYPQCGGTVGLENFPPSHTIMVEEFTNAQGQKRYVNNDLGDLGQCAKAQPAVIAPASTLTPTPVSAPAIQAVVQITPIPQQSQSQEQSVVVQQPVSVNQSQQVPLTSQVIVQAITPTPTPGPVVKLVPLTTQSVASQPKTLQCPDSTTPQVLNAKLFCISQPPPEVPSQNNNNLGPVSANSSSAASATGGNATVTVNTAASPQAAPPVIVKTAQVPIQTIVVTPTPLPQAVVITPTQAAPTTQNLPQTGLPKAAWSLTGLIPIGWIMRFFGQSKVDKLNVSKYLWEKRKFQKGGK